MVSGQSGRIVIFTIVSANYIAYAATLMQSVRNFDPNAVRVIVLADQKREFPDIDLAAELVPCDELAIPQLDGMKLWYSVLEFNTAIKPYSFRWLFDHYEAKTVIYLDPDICLFAPLKEVKAALRTHSIVLVPHVLAPLQDGREPSDHTIMKSGVYNLGFFAARADADALGLVAWWADRCKLECRVDLPRNLFTDQRWMDMAPALVSKPFILRHPGYNVAYWNLIHREVQRGTDGRYTVNGRPLVFFHFSGIVPDDPTVFSKHQNRFKLDDLGAVAGLCDAYRGAVIANRWRRYSTVPYAFDRFADGGAVELPMRRWLQHALDVGLLTLPLPAGLNTSFFDDADEELERSGAVITRLMHQLWRDRADLQAAFSLRTDEGRAGYLEWFLSQAAEQGVSQRAVAGAAAANGRGTLTRQPVRGLTAPPWPSLARLEGTDGGGSIRDLLQRQVVCRVNGRPEELPAAMALVWENRIDLQQAFPLTTLQSVFDFIAWVMTEGVRQGALDADELPDRFIEAWVRVSRMSGLYGDVPLTEGMIATRSIGAGRSGLGDISRFPTDKRCREAHGLWFAYWAPNEYGWPARLVAPVRAYFAEPTPVRVGEFALRRGEVALWELRRDLQRAFPLADDRGVIDYLFWLASRGLDEIGFSIEDFDPRLIDFFRKFDAAVPWVPRFARMVYDMRPDLQQSYDIATEEGKVGLAQWCSGRLHAEYGATPFIRSITSKGVVTGGSRLQVGVVLTGYWTAPTGRGEDVRCTAECLRAIGYRDYVVADLGARRFIGPDGEPFPIDYGVDARFNIVHTNADTALADLRAIRSMRISAARAIGYWAWELERMPGWWRFAYTCYDEIWAATRFAYDAFAAERLRPVVHIPLAVTLLPELPPSERLSFGWTEDETVFLLVFDMRSYVSRKNPEAVIDAFRLAFPDGARDARLAIKTQGGKERPLELEALRARAAGAAIEIIDGEFPREKLIALIRSADCFVSLHRSEGFGRGPAEAMLLGKPVILTDYSGTVDFADQACALPVECALVAVKPGEYPGAEGQRWANPSIAAAAAKMRLVKQRPVDMRRLGIRARSRIIELFSPGAVGAKIAAHLGLAVGPAGASRREGSVAEAAIDRIPGNSRAEAKVARLRQKRLSSGNGGSE